MVFGTVLNQEYKAKASPKKVQIDASSIEVEEPLLKEASGQYVIFPIQHEDMWKMYKLLVENFWCVPEHLSIDLELNTNEQECFNLFTCIFASCTHSFGLVNENFIEEFSQLVHIPEAKFFYGHQLFVQNIHYEMYNKLLDTLVSTNSSLRGELIDRVEASDVLQAKKSLIAQFEHLTFSDKLVASACLHGLLFSSLNCIQEWLKKRNSRFNHDFVEFINKMIVDQDLERDFACLMVSHLRNKPSKEFILKTIDEFTNMERDFLYKTLKIQLLDLNDNEIRQLLDRQSMILKFKLLKALEKKQSEIVADKENESKFKPNHVASQKITFDDDF